MTFIDFKKLLLDSELSIPKFTEIIKVSEKNIQAYKKKKQVPNTIAVIATCFAKMNKESIDFRSLINNLELEKKEKKGSGFSKKKSLKDIILELHHCRSMILIERRISMIICQNNCIKKFTAIMNFMIFYVRLSFLKVKRKQIKGIR